MTYKASSWSEAITTYTDLSTVSLSSVLSAINDKLPTYTCTKLLNLYQKDDMLYFNALGYSENGTERLITLNFFTGDNDIIVSLENFLENYENNNLRLSYSTCDYVEYSSLESFIKSGEATTIQSYIDQGYRCTVISEAGENSTNTHLTTYGVVCLENESEKIYISVCYDIYLEFDYESYDEEYKFTTLLEDSNNIEFKRESIAQVLDGDFMAIFVEMQAMNDAAQ